MIGRNSPCPCGSGKKYKRCCFSEASLGQTGAGHYTKERLLQRKRLILNVFLVVVVGVGVYLNSFSGTFVLDDVRNVPENTEIRRLWPPWHLLSGTTRPLIDLSLALNYALGGLKTWGYHAVNLVIHILAALVLYGFVCRTLQTPPLSARYSRTAPYLALSISLLWVAHPLQTQAVTYIIQRAESLMSLWYLLILYCVLRGVESVRRRSWYTAAILACILGMASKPVMVTAPIMVLLYDRVFLAGSFRQAFRQRKALYVGLAATWLLLAALLIGPHESVASAGFFLEKISPLEYVATQPGVLLHYLRLSVWPHPLVVDYNWPIAGSVRNTLPQALVIVGLLLAAIWAWRHKLTLGFVCVWFFLILAPTSSIIPISDPAFEYRMYLPLAGIIVLVVFGAEILLCRAVPASFRRPLAVGLVAALVVTLGVLTIRRNYDYHSDERIWRDTIAKRPNNARAHNNLGLALARKGNLEEAVSNYLKALQLQPNDSTAHNNLGNALVDMGRLKEAETHYVEAIRLKPRYARAHANLGSLLADLRKPKEAISSYKEALRLEPDLVEAHANLGSVLADQGKPEEAIHHQLEAIRLRPDFAEAHYNLGTILLVQEKVQEAIACFERALQLNPDFADAHNNMGFALFKQGKVVEAISHYTEALRLNPNHADARRNLDIMIKTKDGNG